MNEIIQNLEANATNGEKNFCYISENKLNALKELSKREYEELKKKDEVIEKAIKYINSQKYYDLTYNPECPWDYSEVRKDLLQILEDKEV